MTHATSIIDAAWPQASASFARQAALVLLGSALIALSAQFEVPMWPVPMTLQTFAVLLVGLSYGARLGAATLALYLAEGAVGFPVFSGGAGGPAHLVGPTAGYLFGFVAAAAAAGWCSDRGLTRGIPGAILATVAGTAIIYLLGAGWLTQFVGGLGKAIEFGVMPFIAGDAIKALLAALCLPAAWKTLGTLRD